MVLDKGDAVGSGSTSASSAVVRFGFSTEPGVVAAYESGHGHDTDPVLVDCPLIGRSLEPGAFSRNRTGSLTSGTVLG